MKIVKLTTTEQLMQLKKNDKLIVQWAYHSATNHKFDEITMTKIWGINRIGEVIVRKKDNLYFSIEMFLSGESCAKEVYLVTAGGESL
jgi:hypothetical protein